MAAQMNTPTALVVDEKPKLDQSEVEFVGDRAATCTPAEIQNRFDTLRGLSQGEMEALNKKVRSRIDWRMMPIITLMFLMR